MLHWLTAPQIVSPTPLPNDWSVLGLLQLVAEWNPPLHALIDTGALVTGMSNVEVRAAARMRCDPPPSCRRRV